MPINALLQQAQTELNHKNFEQVLLLAQKGIASYPQVASFYFFAGFSSSQLNLKDQAYQYQLQACQLEPSNAGYHFNAAVYAQNAGTREMSLRAMLHYQNALHANPDHLDSLWNYGELLRLDGHIELAIKCFNRLIELNCLYPKIHNRLVAAYECIDEPQKVDALYELLLQDQSDAVTAWGYTTEQLRRENFKTGWEYYNRRFECSWLNNAYHYPFDLPFWDGVLRENTTLLIHGEQGLGDEMMFASTFNELLVEAQAANVKIIIGCKTPLARLFKSSFPQVEVFIHHYESPMDIESLNIDAHLPMGNLLSRYRQSLADFTAHHTAYLHANADRSAYYEQRIQLMGREAVDGKRRLRVGLMWSTVANETVSRFVLSASNRSIPVLELSPLAEFTDDVEFISLQNHECGAQAALIPQLDIVDFSLDQIDFYDTAALMQNLDLVITIDTSIFHLSAAMGLETWVPLIKHPEWRFGRADRSEAYWYGNTRYFRQTQKGRWVDVIENVCDALRDKIAAHKTTSH